jgi:putative membrane protein
MSAWRIEMVGMKSVLATLFTTLVVWSSAWADQGGHPDMGDMMGNMEAWGWAWMIFGPIMMIVFIAVAVVVVVLLLRWLGGLGHGGALHSPPGKTLLDILKERFAKGEIDKEELEERRRVLGE